MKATYIDHMGTDLSVVNAAKVRLGKSSEWEGGSHPAFDKPKHLSKKDQGLIQFLARGCTSGDWEKLVDEVTSKILQFYAGFALNPVTEEECEVYD